ncbi:MAG: indole-3-glycerol phosphate synthase TrpC [Prevotellaceae bacterium]|jgi:indole-3-glycerol phosphate synthase|nr:indole-3-glycerol phosphate synthase TrpC [Prevotellaceae bacterium]
MKDILTDIIAHKRAEVERQKQAVSPKQLHALADEAMFECDTPRRSMRRALADSPVGIIAEFKRRSPSKGWIKQEARPERIVPAYERAGAAALSILTDEHFFGGSLRDIRTARPLVDIPILRKDFIIDEYQLLQARIVGADAVLLIAACLTREQCATLLTQAHRLSLEVLLEVHSPDELPYITPDADMVGVNNRHLGSFVTDVENSFRFAAHDTLHIGGQETLHSGRGDTQIFVSESGISHPDTIRRLRKAGYRGFLIGETFMKTEAPGEALRELIEAVQSAPNTADEEKR